MECGGSSCPGGYCDNFNAGTQWVMYQAVGCSACAYDVDSSLSTGANCTYWSLVDGGGNLVFHSNLSNFAFPPSVQPGSYTLQLKVSDQAYNSATNPTCAVGNTDTDSRPFLVKAEAQAKFKCSFDDPAALAAMIPPQTPNWQDCTSPNNAFSKKVVKGEKIYVTDNGSQYSGDASKINSWNWTFTVDGGAPLGSVTNAVTNNSSDWTSFTTGASNVINLKVIDDCAGTGGNRSGCASTSIAASKVFKWQEVSPVSMVWQYLTATVSKMFTAQ